MRVSPQPRRPVYDRWRRPDRGPTTALVSGGARGLPGTERVVSEALTVLHTVADRPIRPRAGTGGAALTPLLPAAGRFHGTTHHAARASIEDHERVSASKARTTP